MSPKSIDLAVYSLVLAATEVTAATTTITTTSAATTTTTATTTIAAEAATTAAEAATTAAAVTTAAATALFAWACFVNHQWTTHKLFSIERFDRSVHSFFRFHRHEGEATRTARLTILYDENIFNSSVRFKQALDILKRGIEGEISYIHFCIHSISLTLSV
jgi:phage tail sheath gpL-like